MNFQRNKYGRPKMVDVTSHLERSLVTHITKTGKEQIKRRRKAGLSVYFLKEGRIVEVKPDRTEIKGKEIGSRWVTLEKKKRTVVLK